MSPFAGLEKYARALADIQNRISLDDSRSTGHRLRWVAITAIRIAAIFGGYWIAWHYAALFDVSYRVSAMFLTAGLTVFFSMLLKAAWLPIIYVACGSVAMLDAPDWRVADFDGLGTLRHVAVYGLMGLYLRRTSFRSFLRFSLETASRFVSVAFLASLTATALVQFTHTYDSQPHEQRGLMFLSMWSGDLSGVMIGAPTLLLVWRFLESLMHWEKPYVEWMTLRLDPLPIAQHGLFACSVACFAAWLPSALDVDTAIPVLMFFPIVLAGLSRGVVVGFTVAAMSCATYLLAEQTFGTYRGQPIDLQLILAISSALALLSGAAHDDRWQEWKRANFDMLTGLPNRRLLADRIEQAWQGAKRHRHRMAVLYLDLDRFKEINDTYGHDAGDRLLVQAAERISNCLRASDSVARLAGDEFVVVLSNFGETTGVERVAEKILRSLEQPFTLGEELGFVSGSIGIAVFPEDGDDPETLELLADQALYEAKREGRNRYIRRGQDVKSNRETDGLAL